MSNDDLIRRGDVIVELTPKYAPAKLGDIMKAAIERVPAVDAVRVVRCVNCRHVDIGENSSGAWCQCKLLGVSTDPYGYCDRGLNKEDKL